MVRSLLPSQSHTYQRVSGSTHHLPREPLRSHPGLCQARDWAASLVLAIPVQCLKHLHWKPNPACASGGRQPIAGQAPSALLIGSHIPQVVNSRRSLKTDLLGSCRLNGNVTKWTSFEHSSTRSIFYLFSFCLPKELNYLCILTACPISCLKQELNVLWMVH